MTIRNVKELGES